MKLNVSDELDRQLVDRYSMCLLNNPNSLLVGGCIWTEEVIEKALNGELTHMLYRVGNLVYSRWVPTMGVQHFFDAYGQ